MERALKGGIDALEGAGLSTHERALGSSNMDMLGVELNPAYRCTRLTDTRYWRLERGIDAALRRRRLSGRAVEAILGHCTFAGLLNRASLSIFHASYKFIRLHYDVPTALWESVRGELQAFRDILPMIEADWTLPWNPHVTVTDASNSGFGECTGVWDARAEDIESLARFTGFELCAQYSDNKAWFIDSLWRVS